MVRLATSWSMRISSPAGSMRVSRSRVNGLHAEPGCVSELHVGRDEVGVEVLGEHDVEGVGDGDVVSLPPRPAVDRKARWPK